MTSMSRLRGREPQPRLYHASVGAEENMLTWGGFGGRMPIKTSAVESFNVLSASWKESRPLHGQTPPDNLRDMAICTDGERAYFFGGEIGPTASQECYNKLYQVDLRSLECKELVPASGSETPSPRASTRMVCLGRTLVTYGGYTGANVRSNEIHTFNLDTSKFPI